MKKARFRSKKMNKNIKKKLEQICKAMLYIALHILLGSLLVYTFGSIFLGMLGVGF